MNSSFFSYLEGVYLNESNVNESNVNKSNVNNFFLFSMIFKLNSNCILICFTILTDVLEDLDAFPYFRRFVNSKCPAALGKV